MFSGKIDTFLENQSERIEHDRRVNETVRTKQKQLEKFIAKNRAGANTSSQARSKTKQLERLKLSEIAVDEPIARIRAPLVQPRQGTAVRCQELAMGYPDHEVAADIQVEIEHGERVAIVGDNGQGKTTLLRTLVGSLDPLAGRARWGHGCEIGVYAQHVYTTLPEKMTVLEYLEHQANAGTTHQDIMAQAGALLFRDAHINKKIAVLSGGERARLCLAGLLLGTYNILVLDEPGNHLDVETVDALANALIAYRGTVIFTSHDRYFMQLLATSVIEVRDGKAKNYLGNYEAYVYAMNREIDEGERQLNASKSTHRKPAAMSKKGNDDYSKRDHRKIRKEISNVERKIAQLDERRRELDNQLLTATDPDEALKLHNEVAGLSKELAAAEERWCELSGPSM
jgi:ATP-binding cassette subfamily F protein 3